MPPGGERTGQPQTAYRRRSDLNAGTQPVKSAKSVVQGDRQRRESAQQVIPLPATQGPPKPGSLTSLTAPTERPGEPITAGLPFGAGPGPDSLTMPAASGNEGLFELRALAAANPDLPDLMRLIAYAEENQ